MNSSQFYDLYNETRELEAKLDSIKAIRKQLQDAEAGNSNDCIVVGTQNHMTRVRDLPIAFPLVHTILNAHEVAIRKRYEELTNVQFTRLP